MSNLVTYAGCVLRFHINGHGYVQIDIFAYDSSSERFTNAIDQPLIPSATMKPTRCTVAGSALTSKGLVVLLHLIASNSSILMFVQCQSRPWACHILDTLSIHGSPRFVVSNASMSVFVDEVKNPHGFYLIDDTNNQQSKSVTKIQTIPCALSTYIYGYAKDGYYWLMGQEIDSNTNEKTMKVYYGSSTSLVPFNTDKLIPISHIDNIEDIHLLNHRLQLKTRSIVGDLILLSKDHRILSCHHGSIVQELVLNTPVDSIVPYQTIENDPLFIFPNKDLQSVDIYQYDENFTLTPFTNSHETAEQVLIDDFTQIGWKQVLLLKNAGDLQSFTLTDFSQIHVFQQDADFDYHADEKNVSMDMDDTDAGHSLAIVQDILRKKIVHADYLINEGYSQCKQIENNIRKVTNHNDIPHLHANTQSSTLTPNSIASSPLRLLETNWFVHRNQFFLYVTVKNISKCVLASVHLFGIDKQSNKAKIFDVKPAGLAVSDERTTFSLDPDLTLTFILTMAIELDRSIDLELYLSINDTDKLLRLNPVTVPIDDLIRPDNERILKMTALEMEAPSHLLYRQAFVYFHTLSRLVTSLQTSSKFHLLEHFRQLLAHLGFKPILTLPNLYIRVNQGNIFEHALIQLANEDDLITDDLAVHFYAENANDVTLLAKYVLSKLDFQSFTVLHATESFHRQSASPFGNRLQAELTAYLEAFKQIPTVMRKTTPSSKSEAYRLLRAEDFGLFQHERQLTDLLLASLVVD